MMGLWTQKDLEGKNIADAFIKAGRTRNSNKFLTILSVHCRALSESTPDIVIVREFQKTINISNV